MGPGMQRLLLNERLDGRLQLRVVDERRGLEDGLYEVTLTFRQQQVQNIDHVRNERIAGHPVHRQVRPVKTNLAPKCRMSVVLQIHLGHSSHLSCALWVVGAWLWGRPRAGQQARRGTDASASSVRLSSTTAQHRTVARLGRLVRYDQPMQDL